MKAGIYARISLDRDDTHLGVQRQVEDCEKAALARGWTVVGRYVDNDVSATRAKVRPEYERLIADIRAGAIGALIVWDIDRLTRTPRELEDIIDLASKAGLQLANVGGEIDLSTPQGTMMARMKGTIARHETEQQSRRMKRQLQQKASSGVPHGKSPWGYKRVHPIGTDGKPGPAWDVPDPDQAPYLQEAAARFIRGESLRAITQSFTDRGIPAPSANQWNQTTVRKLLQRKANIGLRVHRGEVIGKSNTEPIFTVEQHEQIMARMNDPIRKSHATGNAPKNLVSRIATCGLCGGLMRVVQQPSATGQIRSYGCMECYKITRKQELVDAVVNGAVIGRLQQPDAVALTAGGDPTAAAHAHAQVRALEARLAVAADQFADGAITGEQLARITQRIRPQIDQSRADAVNAEPSQLFNGLTGPDVAAKWEGATLEIKRLVIQTLMTIVILPAGRGKGRDPESIRIEWKTA